MIDLATAIKQLMNEVTTNSHLEMNHDDTVTYPYLTYSINTDGPDGNQEIGTIEVQIFDHGTSYTRILGLEEELEKVFHKRREFTPELFLQFQIGRRGNVPTATENIKRRDTFISAKIDWRNKQWH